MREAGGRRVGFSEPENRFLKDPNNVPEQHHDVCLTSPELQQSCLRVAQNCLLTWQSVSAQLRMRSHPIRALIKCTLPLRLDESQGQLSRPPGTQMRSTLKTAQMMI